MPQEGETADKVASLERPVLLFDGECNFCRAAVRWLVERDPDGRLHYATLQSAVGADLLGSTGLSPDYRDSSVFIRDGEAVIGGRAVFAACAWIGGRANRYGFLDRLPSWLIESVYRFIARNRSWISALIGTRNRCWEPTGAICERFLDLP